MEAGVVCRLQLSTAELPCRGVLVVVVVVVHDEMCQFYLK